MNLTVDPTEVIAMLPDRREGVEAAWRITLEPGDIVVLEVPEHVTPEWVDKMKSAWAAKYPGTHLSILSGGVRLAAVLRPPAKEEAVALGDCTKTYGEQS